MHTRLFIPGENRKRQILVVNNLLLKFGWLSGVADDMTVTGSKYAHKYLYD